jgi:restriction endonuclease Mrr
LIWKTGRLVRFRAAHDTGSGRITLRSAESEVCDAPARRGAVRDFRGAMAGRGDKSLLITTGTFTADAKKESAGDGAPPIDLIDGDCRCDLLKRYDLGVRTATRTVEDVFIDVAFYGEI